MVYWVGMSAQQRTTHQRNLSPRTSTTRVHGKKKEPRDKTAHDSTQYQGKSAHSAYGQDADNPRPRSRIEAADQDERQAWHGRVVRSAYAAIVALPQRVDPDDTAVAREILGRIRRAIDRGHYTRNEWRRLHAMEEAWGRRATGHDLRFRQVGWSKRPSPWQKKAGRQADAIGTIIDACGDVLAYRS